jgi:hypothetical protein
LTQRKASGAEARDPPGERRSDLFFRSRGRAGRQGDDEVKRQASPRKPVEMGIRAVPGRLALVATAALAAASCTAPQAAREPPAPRAFAVGAPAGCAFAQEADGLRCAFVTADRRTRGIRVVHFAIPVSEMFADPVAARSALESDRRRFLEVLVLRWETLAELPQELTVRESQAQLRDPRLVPAGADACVEFSLHSLLALPEGGLIGHDNQGVRCAAYDPSEDVIEHFMLEYEEVRGLDRPQAPGFAADAERVVRSVRLGLPRG